VPIDDAAALADAYVDVAGDDERRAGMAKAALGRARAFDISTAATRLEQIYADVAARRSR